MIKTYRGFLIRKANRWDRFLAFIGCQADPVYAVRAPSGERLDNMGGPTFCSMSLVKRKIDRYWETEERRIADNDEFESLPAWEHP